MKHFLIKHWEDLLCYGLSAILLAGAVAAYFCLFPGGTQTP